MAVATKAVARRSVARRRSRAGSAATELGGFGRRRSTASPVSLMPAPRPQPQQRLDVAVRRPRLDLAGRADLEQPALLHHPDAVGEPEGLGEVVGDEEHRLAQPPLQPQELLVQLQPGQRVEGAERLVEQHHLRVAGQRPGEGHPLALAARQPARVAAGEGVGVEPDQRQHLAAARQPPLARPAEELRHQLHVARHPPVGDQAPLLLDVADPPPQRDRVPPGHRLAADADLAGARLDGAVEQAEQRGLARAALAHQGDGLAGVDLEVHPGQRPVTAREGLLHPAGRQHGGRGGLGRKHGGSLLCGARLPRSTDAVRHRPSASADGPSSGRCLAPGSSLR